MGLNKPTQELRRDLKGIASNLEQACIDLSRLAQRIDDVDGLAVMQMVSKLYEDVDRLVGCADEVGVCGTRNDTYIQARVLLVWNANLV